jgi:transcriptional regulator with XRE-family HTH domain
MSGMSLHELADAIGNKVTRQALHKYEQGKVLPDIEMIILLSNALKVRPDYFFRTTEVKIEFGE